jgi:hypothetical protein
MVIEVLILTAMKRAETRGPHSRRSYIAAVTVLPVLAKRSERREMSDVITKLVPIKRAHVLKVS